MTPEEMQKRTLYIEDIELKTRKYKNNFYKKNLTFKLKKPTVF